MGEPKLCFDDYGWTKIEMSRLWVNQIKKKEKLEMSQLWVKHENENEPKSVNYTKQNEILNWANYRWTVSNNTKNENEQKLWLNHIKTELRLKWTYYRWTNNKMSQSCMNLVKNKPKLEMNIFWLSVSTELKS